MKRKNPRPDLTPTQEKALQTILNLRLLTRETGNYTTRAQNSVLRSLNDADLAAVANALALLSKESASSPTVAVQSGKRKDANGNRD